MMIQELKDKVCLLTGAANGLGAAMATAVANAIKRAQIHYKGIDVLTNNTGTGAQIVRPDFISRPLNSWDTNATLQENLRLVSEPAAWPQLVKPIVMQDRGNLS